MKEKRLVDANHFEQVLKNIACALKGELTYGKIKIDPDDGEKEICEYTFKHCPECGAKIIIHKSCEFCRWHLRDTTCFNDLEKRPRTAPEDSCWNWEERE